MDYSEYDKQQEEGFSYQEKSIVISLIGSILVYIVFGALVVQRYRTGGFDSATVFQFWGRAFLLLIGVQIGLAIIGHIVLHVIHAVAAREDEIPTFEDERDKLIELKATRNSSVVFGVGFVISMIALAVGISPTVMPVIMMIFIMAAEILGNISKLYLYRRGF